MTEDRQSSSESPCICLFLGLNPVPLYSYMSVLPTRSQLQGNIVKEGRVYTLQLYVEEN